MRAARTLRTEPVVKEDLTAIKTKIRKHVVARKIRLREFFKDFDRHKHGKVTKAQFFRGLDLAGCGLTHVELEKLAARYADRDDEYGTIFYTKFCDVIDKVFTVKCLEKDPLKVPSNPLARMGLSGRADFGTALSPDEQAKLSALLLSMKKLVETQRIATKPYFKGYDHHNSGFMTEPRFRRAIGPCFQGMCGSSINFTEADMSLLCKAYAMHDRAGSRVRDINYRELIGHVDEKGAPGGMHKPPDHQFEPGMLDGSGPVEARPTEDTFLNVVKSTELQKRVVAQIVDKNIPVKGGFRDFDGLRSGYCTLAQFRRALVTCGLKSFKDWELKALGRSFFEGHKGKVHYGQFLDIVSAALQSRVGKMASERTAIQTKTADGLTGNRQIGFDGEGQELQAVLQLIQGAMKTTRYGLKDLYMDFDKRHEGRVTTTQFLRVLVLRNINHLVGEKGMDIIVERFKDKRQGHLVRYNDFLEVLHSPIDVQLPEKKRAYGLNQRWRPKPKEAAGAVDLAALMLRIKGWTKRRNIRSRDFLRDFDPLRRGFMSRHQLITGFSIAKFDISFGELDALASAYAAPESEPPDAEGKRLVAWTLLCDDIESVFTVRGAENNPLIDISASVSQARAGIADQYAPAALPAGEQKELDVLLRRINDVVMFSRVEIERPFKDFDPNRSGSLTAPQFKRAIRTAIGNAIRCAGRAKGEGVRGLNERDVNLLLKAYCHPTEAGRTVYRTFIRDVDKCDGVIGNLPEALSGGAFSSNVDPHRIEGLRHGERPLNRGSLQARGDTGGIDQLLDKIANFTATWHVRLNEFMNDYDRLRKGYLTKAKFRTALNSMGCKLEREEFELLEKEFEHYALPDMVEYGELIRRIDPQLKVGNTRSAAEEADGSTGAVLKKLRDCVIQKRALPKPYFESYDTNHQGTVTGGQFMSVLSFLQMLPLLTPEELTLLKRRFANGSGQQGRSCHKRLQINYVEFCKEVDPNYLGSTEVPAVTFREGGPVHVRK